MDNELCQVRGCRRYKTTEIELPLQMYDGENTRCRVRLCADHNTTLRSGYWHTILGADGMLLCSPIERMRARPTSSNALLATIIQTQIAVFETMHQGCAYPKCERCRLVEVCRYFSLGDQNTPPQWHKEQFTQMLAHANNASNN